MKKYIVLLLVFVFFGTQAWGETVYVSSFAANIHSDASLSASKIMKLKRGDKMTVISKQGSWLNVKANDKTGWIKEMFTSDKPAGEKVSILSMAKTNVNVHVRKRASADVTAASARGLREDKEMEARLRAKDSGKIDPAALDSLELMVFSENDLFTFLAEENIQ
ncbi:MAG: SH3 domain-containing protein [Spirochaetia bacterium]|nr:SH3 domain-containing protein [Spirochaetia bacterium]